MSLRTEEALTIACFPASDDRELLQAAFAPLPQAQQAWQNWRSRHTLEACHYVSHRLLSLIGRRLPRESIPVRDQHLLRGLYRYHWTRNQLLTRSAVSILSSLQQAGVETLILKGLALAHLVYRDVGVRPMNDFDVLIRPAQRELAVATLERCGWQPSHPLPDLFAWHGCEFRNAEEQRFDLHWFSTDESRWLGADDDFWQHSRPFPLPGVETRAPDPAHLLLHCLIHGVKVSEADPVVWVTDACAILDSVPDLNWSLFLESARIRRVVSTVRLGLQYLQERMSRPFPEWVLGELSSTPVCLTDRLYYHTKIRCHTGWTALARPYLDYVRTERPRWGGDLVGFLNFLRRRWQLGRIRAVPRRILQGIWRRCRWAWNRALNKGR